MSERSLVVTFVLRRDYSRQFGDNWSLMFHSNFFSVKSATRQHLGKEILTFPPILILLVNWGTGIVIGVCILRQNDLLWLWNMTHISLVWNKHLRLLEESVHDLRKYENERKESKYSLLGHSTSDALPRFYFLTGIWLIRLDLSIFINMTLIAGY